MANSMRGAIASVVALLAFSLAASAQIREPGVQQNAPSVYDQLMKSTKPAGPAPKRDLMGAWAGPIGAKVNAPPPMTPLGQQRFSLNKGQEYTVAERNDPLNTCDPLGFPQNVLFETRSIAFAQMTDRVVELFQYQKVYREIFTDGRALPTNVGAKGGPDPRYYGYSVGHWDGDYTFVVDTVGTDDQVWLDHNGHPHSADLHVQERYQRKDHDTLVLTVTIDDPKIYTKPFEITETTYKWIPDQQFEEQLCVPSVAIEYMNAIGYPAGTADGKTVKPR
jgi:hypothetical protein